MKEIFHIVASILIILLVQSCSLSKKSNFNRQKFTELKSLKSNKGIQIITPPDSLNSTEYFCDSIYFKKKKPRLVTVLDTINNKILYSDCCEDCSLITKVKLSKVDRIIYSVSKKPEYKGESEILQEKNIDEENEAENLTAPFYLGAGIALSSIVVGILFLVSSWGAGLLFLLAGIIIGVVLINRFNKIKNFNSELNKKSWGWIIIESAIIVNIIGMLLVVMDMLEFGVFIINGLGLIALIIGLILLLLFAKESSS